MDRFDRKPDFINEAGVRWWNSPFLTSYAVSSGFKDLRCFMTERIVNNTPIREYVVTDDNEVLHTTQSFEGVAVWIDIQKLIDKNNND